MIEIYLLVGDQYVGQRNWVTVPRVGESMILLNPNGAEWVCHDKETGLTANVHLKLVDPLRS